VAGGEGVYGLQRAFHLAGCKNVVASLWRVDDDATAALMGVFYRKLWQEKLSPLEALRQAQIYLYRNPSAIPALAKRRGDLFAEVDLPKETIKPGAKSKHALTSQWAAFVLSGTGR
jgi:CHAT domain-containing protein